MGEASQACKVAAESFFFIDRSRVYGDGWRALSQAIR
jgi:hypothetical protein